MNRIWNAKNHFQGPAKRVLAVCSAGLLRSPTIAWVLSNPPYNFNTRACGFSDYALVKLDDVLLYWADEIVLADDFGIDMPKDKPVHILEIPDNYVFRDPELVKIINKKVADIWPTATNSQ